jgi:hypothetical protein
MSLLSLLCCVLCVIGIQGWDVVLAPPSICTEVEDLCVASPTLIHVSQDHCCRFIFRTAAMPRILSLATRRCWSLSFVNCLCS